LRDTSPRAVADLALSLEDRIRSAIRDVPDFPKPGILFKDLTPLIADAGLLRDTIARLAQPYRDARVDRVAAVEARGFIFGAPLALALGAGFLPVRKPGKLPHRTERVDYALEYGTDALEAHRDGVIAGERIVLVDDLLATGGTAQGALQLIRRLRGDVVGVSFVVELAFLGGRARLDAPVQALVAYDQER
jgi:adenine phosphoribosyltransferase